MFGVEDQEGAAPVLPIRTVPVAPEANLAGTPEAPPTIMSPTEVIGFDRELVPAKTYDQEAAVVPVIKIQVTVAYVLAVNTKIVFAPLDCTVTDPVELF